MNETKHEGNSDTNSRLGDGHDAVESDEKEVMSSVNPVAYPTTIEP